jgi:hypothetical protein
MAAVASSFFLAARVVTCYSSIERLEVTPIIARKMVVVGVGNGEPLC